MISHQSASPADKQIVHDGTPVRLLEDGEELWSGKLVDLETINLFTPVEREHLRRDLLKFGRWTCGGRVSPLNVIEVMGRFALVAIGTAGRDARRFERATHAVAIASIAAEATPNTVVLVITDLETGCVIWNYAPEPYLHLPLRRSAA